MIKRTLFLTLLAVASVFTLTAQNVDDILGKYIEITGGLDNWRAMKSTKASVNMAMQGMEFPALVYAKPPKMQRVEVNVQGQQIVQAYDGETAWWINPFMGGAEPQPMPAEMAEMMTEQEFESPFIDYQKKGYTAELLGETTVEGAAVYEVKLTKKENDEEFYYFDKDDGVIIMSKKAAKSGPTKGQFAETYYSDYQEVGDFVLPFFLEVKMAGQSIQKMTFKNYEINPEIDDAIFAFPKK